MQAVVAQQGFYELAAQIIPVLLLVLFLGESRVVRLETKGPNNWRSTVLMGIGVVGVLLLGEMAALRVVSQGHDTYFLHGVTVMALVYGFIFVFAQATKLLLLARGAIPADRQTALGRLYMLVVVIALCASFVILDPGLLL